MNNLNTTREQFIETCWEQFYEALEGNHIEDAEKVISIALNEGMTAMAEEMAYCIKTHNITSEPQDI
jgi:hypothetical protein